MSQGIGLDENVANRIEGGTDGTQIGNIGDRLKVTALALALPDVQLFSSAAKLANGGSVDMNVNGSVTPVTFSAGPTTTNEEWYVTRISFVLNDSGTSRAVDFGAIAGGLTNGVLLRFVINSTNYTTGLFKTNYELIANSDNIIRGQSNAFINDLNFVSATKILSNPILLKQSQGDVLQAVVQDNLTGLDLFQIFLGYVRLI